uniref:Uncharacterized protein n=1 Tax=Felis catus TaxID=9685 RepID=A0ABI7WFJ2_FELCA
MAPRRSGHLGAGLEVSSGRSHFFPQIEHFSGQKGPEEAHAVPFPEPEPEPGGRGRGLTGDLHHAVLGLDRQLLGGEVVDVQGHAPAVGRLPDLRDAAAELPAERAAVGGRGHRGGALDRGQRAHVARPAAVAEPLRPLLGQPGQPEGLVEEAAVGRVPVAERVPAGAPQEREGHSALGHVGSAPRVWLRLGERSAERRPRSAFMRLQPGIFSRRCFRSLLKAMTGWGQPLPLHSSPALGAGAGRGRPCPHLEPSLV